MKQKIIATAAVLLLLTFGAFGAFTSRDAFGMPSDVGGIPDGNPSHHPEDGDGVCEKGETVIKTTPSGRRVNVPCQAAHDGGDDAAETEHSHGHGNGHGGGADADDGGSEDD